MHVCAADHGCQKRASHASEVTSVCEALDVGAGISTLVLMIGQQVPLAAEPSLSPAKPLL